jgi:hypothetical protein
VSITQPLSGESSVLDTGFLIKRWIFFISTKEGAKSKEQRARSGDRRVEQEHEQEQEHEHEQEHAQG